MDSLLDGLTAAQREAVQHVDGPLLILAGPGSGKTRVVTHRIAYLLQQGVYPRQILALTFTNKAAEEMRSRVEALAPDKAVWMGTYHRFCAQLLRRHAPLVGLQENYSIYDTEQSGRALRQAITRLKLDLAHFTPENVANAISWAKNRLITSDDYQVRPGHPLGTLVRRIYPAYQAQLLQSNACDFDDLLLHVAVLLRDNPEVRSSLDDRYRYVLVDEYQDTNLAQYAIARAISVDHPNLAVTGDPDQSIYGWRGANLDNILEFERDFPDVRIVRLERNYRSTKRILHVAAQLIGHNLKRKQKDLFTENGEGRPVRLVSYANHQAEARQIAERIARQVREGKRRPRDFAIFYRVNALSWPFEAALREAGVPYQLIHGQEFFQRREIKDVLAYLQLLNNPRDAVTFQRVVNTPARGIGKATLDRIDEHAAARSLPLLEAARDCRNIAGLGKRPCEKVLAFVQLVDQLTALAAAPVEEILGHVLTASGYKKQFENSGDEDDQQRLANIEELLSVAREFDERHAGAHPLEEFLEQTALVNDTDDLENQTDRVTLMTLHASKGLEFPVVFLVAAEQGLLPHERSQGHADQLEEERRLMFVGITRAQEELQISRAGYRDYRGQRKMTVPSEFLFELPRVEMELVEHEAASPGEAAPDPYRQEESAYDEPCSPAIASAARAARCSAAPSEPPPPAASVPRLPGVRLTTAAEMAGAPPAPAVSPDEFHQGMLVRHPAHGLGRVVALSGAGPSRRATVSFPSGQVKFVIAQSPLRPVAGK